MKLEKILPGEYRARLGAFYVWILRDGHHQWWWCLGGREPHQIVWGTDNGPFPTMRMAIADAIANYEGMADKIVWWVHRPTYMGRVEPPAMWWMEAVISGSERDKTLAEGRTVNSAGDYIEIPGQWWRFEDRTAAEAWMRASAERWEEWY